MRIAQFRVSDRGQMALPADARHRWELVKGAPWRSLTLATRCSSSPPDVAGYATSSETPSMTLGATPSSPPRSQQTSLIWLERAHSGGRRPPPPTNSVERRAGIAPTYWCTGAHDRALVPPAEPSALQPDSRGHPFPSARQSRPVDRGRRSPSSYGAT